MTSPRSLPGESSKNTTEQLSTDVISQMTSRDVIANCPTMSVSLKSWHVYSDQFSAALLFHLESLHFLHVIFFCSSFLFFMSLFLGDEIAIAIIVQGHHATKARHYFSMFDRERQVKLRN
jgi:hypothetical protein